MIKVIKVLSNSGVAAIEKLRKACETPGGQAQHVGLAPVTRRGRRNNHGLGVICRVCIIDCHCWDFSISVIELFGARMQGKHCFSMIEWRANAMQTLFQHDPMTHATICK